MRHAIIYVPGLGDHRLGGQQWAVRQWQRFGVHAEILAMQWLVDEPFADKLERLLARIDQLDREGYRVSLVGVSAGASVVLHALAARPTRIHRVIYLCGKVQNVQTVSPYTYQRNPAFKEALRELPASLAKLDSAVRQRILSIRPLLDGTVSVRDTILTGTQQKIIWTIGHALSIAWAITARGRLVVRFITSPK